MSSSAEGSRSCSTCSSEATVRRFDLTVRSPEGRERLFFGMLASLCRRCGTFLLEGDLAKLIAVGDGDVITAIGSDGYLTSDAA